jgi:endonuclease/exonuclease/phosphatase family metal-dependent hydrolase
LLTRFPIVARDSRTELKYLMDDQIMPVQRGFLDCTVELKKGFQLRCIGVHLKSKRPVPDADEALMRRNEAHLLRKHLDSVLQASADAKLLLYGDFNDERNSPALVEITGVRGSATGMQDLFLTDSRKERWTHYWQFEDIYSRLDYLFVSRGLNGYVARRESFIYDSPDYYQGSDHRPLVTKIYLTKK